MVCRKLAVLFVIVVLSFDEQSLGQTPSGGSAEPTEIKAIIDRAEQALNTNGSNCSAILSDPAYLSAHGWPRFRELIKTHAGDSKLTMVTPQEPGTRLHVRLRFMDVGGSPLRGALVYLYHTNATGDYGANDANVPLAGSDNNYARLFGYVTTDNDGTIEVQSIRPGGYPDTTTPAHIHLRIWSTEKRSFGSEIWFEDDPRVTPELRAEAAQEGVVTCPVTIDKSGTASIEASVTLD